MRDPLNRNRLLDHAEVRPVAWKTLGDVLNLRAGQHVPASKIAPEPDELHTFPCFGGNGGRGYVENYSHDGAHLLIGRQGALCGNVHRATGKFFATEHAVVATSTAEISIDWAFHLLTQMNLNQYASRSAQPGLAVGTLNKLSIPVPPLDVQREIVRVLDSFTKLEAKLEAELEARRRQYTYYRDALLTFDEQADVRWTTMGQIGTFTRGRRFTKADMVTEGLACIHYGEIYTRYGTSATTPFSRVRADMKSSLRFAQTGDVIIAGVGETVEDVGKAVAWLGDEPISVHDDCFAFRHDMNPKFVAYWLQTSTFHAEKVKYVARAKVKRLNGDDLAKIPIPVPPLAEQARIVAILDAFDALVNDLSSGLPAEIVARRRQYEHYRDRLLTFRESA